MQTITVRPEQYLAILERSANDWPDSHVPRTTVYDIPDFWLMGMERVGYTVEEAVRHWQDQDLMERRANERAASHD